jgi:nitric oxide reductase NorD protein
MEEKVGQWWDAFIRARALKRFPEAEVTLDEVAPWLAITFRALGGSPNLKLTAGQPQTVECHRSWLQRLAGVGDRFALAHVDGEALNLPERIDWMPDATLNRDAYLWLTLLCTTPQQHRHPVEDMRRRSCLLLKHFPGLSGRYRRLVEGYLATRPKVDDLPSRWQHAETRLARILRQPDLATRPPDALAAPVLIWPLAESRPVREASPATEDPESAQGGAEPSSHASSRPKRRRAKRVKRPNEKDGLMLYRFETIFSRAEYASLNRGLDDDQDDNQERIADDLDELAITRTESGSGRLKMDLDLPAEEAAELSERSGILLPEWDYRKQHMRKAFVRLLETTAPTADDPAGWQHLQVPLSRLKKQLQSLLPERVTFRQQPDGDDIDLESWLDFYSEQSVHPVGEPRLYTRTRARHRDLATLVLADLSLSTDTWLDDHKRVIDTLKDSLFVLHQALDHLGDPHAIAGFWSKRNQLVNYVRIKDFAERQPDKVAQRLAGLKPGYYTRMGAAIRHASAQLKGRGEKQKLLLLITDGKPNDLDRYEGRYGIEDTRHAILEARQKGLIVFCVTVDRQAEDYLPHIFGRHHFALIQRPEQLPEVLPRLYLHLTGAA